MDSTFMKGTMLEMTWEEIEKHAKNDAVVLFPVAVVEEHGPHMSVSVDIFMAYTLALESQKKLMQAGIDSVIAPPFYWGINGTTKQFPGSFYVSNEAFTLMLTDIFMSLKNWGFKTIIAIPGHAETDHLCCIDAALKTVYEKTGPGATMILSRFVAKKSGIEDSDYTMIFDTDQTQNDNPDGILDNHAGMLETSFMLQYYPDHVKSGIIPDLKPTDVKCKDYALWEEGGEFFAEKSPLGYLGDPASAKAEYGKLMIDTIIAASFEKFKQLSK